jgi:hypothetical protein
MSNVSVEPDVAEELLPGSSDHRTDPDGRWYTGLPHKTKIFFLARWKLVISLVFSMTVVITLSTVVLFAFPGWFAGCTAANSIMMSMVGAFGAAHFMTWVGEEIATISRAFMYSGDGVGELSASTAGHASSSVSSRRRPVRMWAPPR